MNKNVFKVLAAALVFAVAFLGVSVSAEKVKVAGEQQSVTLFSLGTQAKAYCNEVLYAGEALNGYCNGAHNSSDSRCIVSTNSSNCVRDN